MLHTLPLSLISSVDKRIALYRAVLARIRHLEFQLTAHRGRSLPPSVAFQARKDKGKLEKEADRLVNNSFVSHTQYHRARLRLKSYGKLDCHLDRLFGPHRIRPRRDGDKVEQMLFSVCRDAARSARQTEILARLRFEMRARVHFQGWFVVFNTLTVAPGAEKKVFSPAATAFKDYLRRV